jgi:hypothetical protein
VYLSPDPRRPGPAFVEAEVATGGRSRAVSRWPRGFQRIVGQFSSLLDSSALM